MTNLTLRYLGSFQATLGGTTLAHFHSVKVQALLAYLTIEADRPHTREALMALLWPDDAPQSAQQSLRQALYALRRVLGDTDNSTGEPFVLVTRQTIQFNPRSQVTLDVTTFLQQMQQGNLAEAVAVYSADLLVGMTTDSAPFEEWLRTTREYLHNIALNALNQLTQQRLDNDDFAGAITYALRQLALERWREEAHRQVMMALALSGERSSALAQYNTCRRVLIEELGVDPAEETVALYEQIRSGQLRGQAASATPRPASPNVRAEPLPTRHNLPPQPTPFIGRKADLEQITTRLDDPTCRLLTIVGPGGMGKTRLATQAAQKIRDSAAPSDDSFPFADGIIFIALAGVASPDLLVSTIATALDFTFYGSGEPKSQLLAYLQPKALLLILDNCEHLLDGIDLVADLLAAALAIKILATSRESLNLREEWLYPLSGMSFPKVGAVDDSGRVDVADYTALQLFIQCASRMKPNFDFAAESHAVVQICQLVEGIPLAIELAAVWRKFYPCTHISQEIRRNFDFLTTSWRNVPSRHRSIRAVFEHSWHLLTTEEQQLFARLAVFRGGFRQEAATQISDTALLSLLALVDKSLLQVTSNQRFQLHELLRQFGEEKLQTLSQAFTQAQEHHCIYYLTFLQQQDAHLKGREYKAAMMHVETEIENIRAAWQWAITHDNFDAINGALDGLFFFYYAKSWWQEGAAVFDQAAARCASVEPAGIQGLVWGKILARQAFLTLFIALENGDEYARRQIETLCHESLALLNRLGQQRETGIALHTLGALNYAFHGKFVEGLQLTQQALLIFTEKGDQWGIMYCFSGLGFASHWMGNYRQAINYFQEGYLRYGEHSDPITLGDLLNCQGEAHKALGEYTAARQMAQAALAARQSADDKRGIAFSLQLLAELAWHMGDYATARDHAQASLALFQAIGLAKTGEVAHNTLGNIASSIGDHQQAKAHFRAVLEPNAKAGMLDYYRQVAEALTGMAALLIKEDKIEQAAELLNQAIQHPATWQETKDRARSLLAILDPDVIAAVERASIRPLTVVVAELLST